MPTANDQKGSNDKKGSLPSLPNMSQTPGYVDILTPLDAHMLRVAPHGDASQVYAALQLTFGDENLSLHTVTMESDHALRVVELILNRLCESGDPRAVRIVQVLRDHYRPNHGALRSAA